MSVDLKVNRQIAIYIYIFIYIYIYIHTHTHTHRHAASHDLNSGTARRVTSSFNSNTPAGEGAGPTTDAHSETPSFLSHALFNKKRSICFFKLTVNNDC